MKQKLTYVIGLMSGTSVDGLDLVYVCFKETNVIDFKIICSETISYSKEWQDNLQHAITFSDEKIKQLDTNYGKLLGNLTNAFIKKNQIKKINFIASHGHTVFHQPENEITLQIGNGQLIATITKQKVVSDFRTQDVALGGQGAPLVPIGDELLFPKYEYCLNLGGFANISTKTNNTRIAYDICPVNLVLNQYVLQLGLPYDDGGKIASKGILNNRLLKELNALSFYQKKHPKSLGLEWVKQHIYPLIDSYNLPTSTILRTFVEHVAIQIAQQIQHKNASILITGGGVFHTFLINRLQKLSKAIICIPSNEIIEFKEALIFSFLGLLRVQNKVNVLRSVTGASKNHSSGKIHVEL